MAYYKKNKKAHAIAWAFFNAKLLTLLDYRLGMHQR